MCVCSEAALCYEAMADTAPWGVPPLDVRFCEQLLPDDRSEAGCAPCHYHCLQHSLQCLLASDPRRLSVRMKDAPNDGMTGVARLSIDSSTQQSQLLSVTFIACSVSCKDCILVNWYCILHMPLLCSTLLTRRSCGLLCSV